MRAMRFAAGVHTSTGLGAGGPVRPATVNPGPEEPVYVTSVIGYIATFLRKNIFFRGFPVFLLLLVAVSTSCILRSSTEIVRRSNMALRQNSLLAEKFENVRTADQFFQVAEDILMAAYRSRDQSRSAISGGQRAVAVTSFVIRQFRTSPAENVDVPMLGGHSYMPSRGAFNVSSPYGTEAVFWFIYPEAANLVADAIVDPANASRVFLPNPQRPEEDLFSASTQSIGGRVYPPAKAQYQLGPYAYSAVTEVEAIRDLRAARDTQRWVSFATKALFIDTLWLSPIEGYFFYGTNSLEVLGSGTIIATTRCYPFRPFAVTKPRHASFASAVVACAADAIIALATVGMLVNMVGRARLEMALAPPGDRPVFKPFRFWMLYDLLLVGLIVTVLVYHALLFHDAAWTADPTGVSAARQSTAAMSRLVSMASRTETADTLKGWLFIVTWLRTFGFLQFVPRLAVMTETVRSAANDLVGVTAIFLLFIAVFSLTGTMLFSDNIVGFATTMKAFDYLSQLVGRGDVEGIEDFEAQSPLASSYFIIYCFMVIAVLLNVVIGILASSFVYTVESFNLVRLHDWKPAAVLRSIFILATRLRRTRRERDRDQSLLRLCRSLEEARAAAWGFSHSRRATVEGANDGDGPGLDVGDADTADDVLVTLRQLRRLGAPLLCDDDLTAEVFRKAQEQRGTPNGKLRYMRIFGRQRQRGEEMARDIAAQTQLLSQVRDQLFGVANDNVGDGPDVGGDDPLLGDNVLITTASPNTNKPDDQHVPTAAERATRPMYGFRLALRELADREAVIGRRVATDHRIASERVHKAADLQTATKNSLAVFAKGQASRAADRTLGRAP